MADIPRVPPILKHTPFIGSATNKTVHKTSVKCPLALQIIPQERWYIKDIPQDGNYTKCTICFPEEAVSTEEISEEVQDDIKKIEPKKKKAKSVKTPKKSNTKKKSIVKKIIETKKSLKKPAAKKKAVSSAVKNTVKKTDTKKKAQTSVAKKKAVSKKKPAVSRKTTIKKAK